MYPEDEKHISFRTPLGVYCYTVMPFGLKNAGATYQRGMHVIFHEHIRKTIECYVDDFAVIWDHRLKISPTKSFLGVVMVNFLDLLLDPKKFIWNQRKSVPSKRCNLREISKNSEAYAND